MGGLLRRLKRRAIARPVTGPLARALPPVLIQRRRTELLGFVRAVGGWFGIVGNTTDSEWSSGDEMEGRSINPAVDGEVAAVEREYR